MNANDLRALLARWADEMAQKRDWLIELDSVVGDSDLGLTMSDGFRAASDAANACDLTDVGKLCYQAGKAMASAVGTMGGIPNSTLRRRGVTKPTSRPHFQPHTKPHSSTGRCMGSSIRPKLGMPPVRKGSTRPAASSSAESTSFLVLLDIRNHPFVMKTCKMAFSPSFGRGKGRLRDIRRKRLARL